MMEMTKDTDMDMGIMHATNVCDQRDSCPLIHLVIINNINTSPDQLEPTHADGSYPAATNSID